MADPVTFVVLDTETSGVHLRFSQILQYAAIDLDGDLVETDRLEVRSRRLAHVLPSPHALRVTGMTPARLMAETKSSYFAARAIHQSMSSKSPAVFLGYNSQAFDDEVLRSFFWQNLLDPYVVSKNGNRRADLRVLLETAVAIDPDVIVRPIDPRTGKPSHRLELLAPANGFVSHHAHDAMGDVEATVFLAKLMRERMPLLWDRWLEQADPNHFPPLLAKPMMRLAVHFGAPEVLPVVFVTMDPENKKQALVFDLRQDPTPYLAMDSVQLAEALRTDFRILRRVKLNAQPALFDDADPAAPDLTPVSLDESAAGETVGNLEAGVTGVTLDRSLLLERARLVAHSPAFKEAARGALLIRKESFEPAVHLEQTIYQGFASRADERVMRDFHSTRDWKERVKVLNRFGDARFVQLGRRIIFDNAPWALSPPERAEMTALVHDRLTASIESPWQTLAKSRAEVAEMAEHPMAAEIGSWIEQLEKAVVLKKAA